MFIGIELFSQIEMQVFSFIAAALPLQSMSFLTMTLSIKDLSCLSKQASVLKCLYGT